MPKLWFKTDDGYVFYYDEETRQWTDEDLSFDARDEDFWPLDADGEPLKGDFFSNEEDEEEND